MPNTARQHFNEDMARSATMRDHAETLAATEAALSGDLLRAAVAAGVGALDAYLCDAYVDCLTRALRTCRDNPKITIPGSYKKELLPVGPLLANKYTQRANWSLRMAARARMEKDNLLQLGRVKELFNPVLPSGKKLWLDVIEDYIRLNRKRLTGISQAQFAQLQGQQKEKAKQRAAASLLRRVGTVVQRRHDIVHNCDRPKVAIQHITAASAKKMLADIKSFVSMLDDHLDTHRTF